MKKTIKDLRIGDPVFIVQVSGDKVSVVQKEVTGVRKRYHDEVYRQSYYELTIGYNLHINSWEESITKVSKDTWNIFFNLDDAVGYQDKIDLEKIADLRAKANELLLQAERIEQAMQSRKEKSSMESSEERSEWSNANITE